MSNKSIRNTEVGVVYLASILSGECRDRPPRVRETEVGHEEMEKSRSPTSETRTPSLCGEYIYVIKI